MKRFWQISVAMVLGLASVSPVVAQQQSAKPQAQARQMQAPRPVFGGGTPVVQGRPQQQNQWEYERQAIPPRVPVVQQQAVAQQQQSNPVNGGALQAQGVNRVPGQQGVVTQQPQNQQFLGTNRPASAPIPAQNQLDEFG